MKINKKSLIILYLIFITPITVTAHPGRTDANGCHTCRTNCTKWGLSYGEYHCHGGSSTTYTYKTPSKSSDNSIHRIYIDGNEYDGADQNIKFKTTKESVIIEPDLKDKKASYKINNPDKLVLGSNKVSITVTAENGNVKTYYLTIYRMSQDTGIEVTIDEEQVEFENNKLKIKVPSSTKKLNLDYTLSDQKSQVKIEQPEELEEGENEIKIIVTAEAGNKETYYIYAYRLSSNTEIEITIDNKEIKFEDNNAQIEVSSSTKKVSLDYKLNSDKATAKVSKPKELKDGDNEIKVVVTAEDGSKEEYYINVYRLSSNKKIKVTINNQTLKFTDNKATLTVSNETEKLSLDYKLNSDKATAKVEELKELKVGENNLAIEVTAEDQTKKVYEIIINREEKSSQTKITSEDENNSVSTIIGLGITGGIGYGIYNFTKKKVKQKKKNSKKKKV